MHGKLPFLLGLGVGYVLGTRAGRERYEELREKAAHLADHPTVQDARAQTREAWGHAKSALQDKIHQSPWGQRVSSDWILERDRETVGTDF